MIEQKDELRAIRLNEFRSRIDEGLAQSERGEGVDGEVLMQGLIDDIEARESRRNAG